MSEIKDILLRIEQKLDLLIKDQETTKVECKKMGEHIDFVESTMERMKTPLRMMGFVTVPPKTERISQGDPES